MLSIIYFGITNKSNAAAVVGTWDISADDGESNVTATLYDDGNFVISGTGKMIDCDDDRASNRPFYSKIEYIKKVEIKNGVTSIGKNTFRHCISLTEITIPNSVTDIGMYEFSGCTSLKEITIPNSVTKIEYKAFNQCSSLTEISIPNSVTTIGICAFSGCSSLQNITVEENNREYCSVDNIIYNKNKTKLIQCAITKAGFLNILEGVKSIERYAFEGCSSLTNINIPNSVTTIGEYAFNQCSSLTEITIPGGVTNIGEKAFIYCNDLTIYTSSDYVANYAKENEINYVLCTMINTEGNSTEWTIEDGKTYMEIKENTTMEKINNYIRTNGKIEVYKGDTKITENNKLLGTGMEIRIKLDNEEIRLTAIVKGDMTGDGKVSIGDLSQLSRYAAGIEKNLSIEYLKASDVVKDGKYGTISDILKMSRVLAKMDTL